MFRQLTDRLSNSNATSHLVSKKFPGEKIQLTTAASVLETPDINPIGWSFRRLLQRRCNVVLTDRRVFIESNIRSPFTLIWGVIFLINAHDLVSVRSFISIFWTVLAAGILFQRRPYTKNIQLTELKDVKFGNVRGLTGHGDIVALNLGTTTIHVVTSKSIPDELKRKMATQG